MWWQWFIFFLILIAIPLGLYKIKDFTEKKIKPTKEQSRLANQRFILLCLFYWLCDLFYMTFIINNPTLKFIFGGLIMVIIFYNLSKVFINGNQVFKVGLIQDFIVGLSLTVYLIYIIPNPELQNIIIPIVSAVYGGLLTLVGVAWTIKNQENIRKEEQVKLQEKERLKYKPYFNGNADKFLTVDVKRRFILQNANIHKHDELEKLKLDKNDKIFYIYPIRFSNSDNSNFIINKITLNGVACERKNFLVNKNEIFDLQALHFIVSKGENIPEIKMFIQDFLENEYIYKINFNVREEELGYSQNGNWYIKNKEIKMLALIMDSVQEQELNGGEDFKNGSGLRDK